MPKKTVSFYIDEDKWKKFSDLLPDNHVSAAIIRLIDAEIARAEYTQNMAELIDAYLPPAEDHAAHHWYLDMVNKLKGTTGD